MSHHQHHGLRSWLRVVLAISWAFMTAQSQAADAPMSADDILEKSQKAMQPPIKYLIRTSGIDMHVSQKLMPDGSITSRTESKQPIEKISLIFGEESYDVFPTHGIAIDTKFMLQGAKTQASTISATLGGRVANSSKIKRTVVRNGNECYEIETSISSDVISALNH